MSVSTVTERPLPPLTGPVLSNMLLGEDEFIEPVHLLRDLTGDQATAVPYGAPESIAQIVWHINYWQCRNLAAIRGEALPRAKSTDESFAAVRSEDWSGLVSSFLADLDEMMGVTEDDNEIARAIGDDETVGDRIRYCAVHNAYHFGQIALLRRLQGFWPPEGGENTW